MKKKLRFLRFSYKRQITLYDRRKAVIASLRSFIQETVSRTYLIYTFSCNSPYEIFITLKQRVTPTDQARKIEFINQYQKLKKMPRNQNLET